MITNNAFIFCRILHQMFLQKVPREHRVKLVKLKQIYLKLPDNEGWNLTLA